MRSPKIIRYYSALIAGIVVLFPSYYIAQYSNISDQIIHLDSTTHSTKNDKYFLGEELIEFFPLRQTKDFIKYLPGIIEYQGKFHLNGSRYDEIDYSLDGLSILDHVSGEQLFEIPKYALEEIGITSFGLPAEYGNLGSGVINFKLKSGRNIFKYSVNHSSDNLGFNNRDEFYDGQYRLGTYWYGYNETNLSAQGPIIKNRLTFFTNANYKFMRDRNPQLYPGIDNLQLYDIERENELTLNIPFGTVYGNSVESYNLIGKISYNQSDFKLDFTGLYENKIKDAPRNHVLDFFNKRLGKIEENTGYFSISAKHKISKTFCYRINASFSFKKSETYDQYLKDDYWSYGDSVANAKVGVIWNRPKYQLTNLINQGLTTDDLRYIPPSDYYFNGYSFSAPNRVTANYSKSYQRTVNFNADFIYKINDKNTLTFGYDITQLLIRQWRTSSFQTNLARSLSQQMNQNSDGDVRLIKKQILAETGMNNFGYNILGNEIVGGIEGAPQPLFTGVFFQNKFKGDRIILDLGLRYDRIDIDAYIFKEIDNWWKAFDMENSFGWADPKTDKFKKTPVFTYLSPRISLKYNLNETTSLIFHYGNYVKQSKLGNIYTNPRYFLYVTNLDFFINSKEITVNNYVKPTVTNRIELNINHMFSKFFNVSLLTFLNKTNNQIIPEKTAGKTENSAYEYLTISNKANTRSMGFHAIFRLSNSYGLTVVTNLSYLNTDALTYYYYRINDEEIPRCIKYIKAPSPYEQAINAKMFLIQNMSYIVTNNRVFSNLTISLSAIYNSGHPYTPSSGRFDMDYNPVFRTPLYNEVNGSLTPSNFQVNLRLDKLFIFSQSISLNLYIYGLNLFNNVNVKDVFLRTGSATIDGYEIDDNLIEAYGENYRTLYELVNIEYNPKRDQQTMFGEPRQIIMGIKLNL